MKYMNSEWVDMAFGGNRGDGAPTKMVWSDLEGNFKAENKRATCTRTAWYKWADDSIKGYTRKRESTCSFDCTEDMQEG
jgi:hypothetical protein